MQQRTVEFKDEPVQNGKHSLIPRPRPFQVPNAEQSVLGVCPGASTGAGRRHVEKSLIETF